MTTTTVFLADCPNCRAPLGTPFCAQCGQKAAPLDPSLRDLAHDVVHELAHVDGKIVQSVRLLLTRPGRLSRDHFEGRRARHVSPVRLYLIFSVLYFAVAAVTDVSAVRLTFKPGPGDDPQQAEGLRQLQHAANEAVIHWAPRALFVLVPLFAGVVAVAARRSGRNYPLHLYFSLHVHAAWFFAGAVVVAARAANVPYLTRAIVGAATLYGAVYLVLAFRRAYDLRLSSALLRAVLLVGVYAFVVALTLVAITVPVVWELPLG